MQNLYRHFDKDHNLLYVGISINPVNRLAQHEHNAHWFEEIAVIEIEKYGSRKEAFIAENDAIYKEKPLYNIRRPMSDAEIEIQSNHSFDNKDSHTILSHKLFDSDITMHTGTGFLSATDLVRAGNRCLASKGLPLLGISSWSNKKSNKAFLLSLEDEFGVVKVDGIGRGHHTWVHPYLFTDIARSFSPTLKVEFYIWLANVIHEITPNIKQPTCLDD